ncbi:hypothetical protein GGR52DRAFT_559978 [Hypoxylon sp. FL1284]|nr:hypothetical protein GGR52DRAFT_559978 [Hypoxylon sp. FL1284]
MVGPAFIQLAFALQLFGGSPFAGFSSVEFNERAASSVDVSGKSPDRRRGHRPRVRRVCGARSRAPHCRRFRRVRRVQSHAPRRRQRSHVTTTPN